VERVIRGRSLTLSKTFYEDGVATDPDSPPTVAITRSDGTTVTAGAVVDETPAGTWSVTVQAADNLLLDTLTADWTGVVNGVAQEYVDYVEVAGDVLFSIADARALKPLDNATQYPLADVIAMRTTVEEALEDACGVAFVPRYRLETVDGPGSTSLLLRPRTTLIRSATVGTTTLSAGDLADLRYSPTGLVSGYNWTCGSSNITVGYEHGWVTPPERMKRAALMLTKAWLVSGPVDDRAATFSSAEGGTYGMVVPGRNGSRFGVPEVDATCDQYDLTCGIA